MTNAAQRRKRRARSFGVSLAVEFPTYTELGSDGLDHIATVATTAEDADAVTALLLKTSARDVASFA